MCAQHADYNRYVQVCFWAKKKVGLAGAPRSTDLIQLDTSRGALIPRDAVYIAQAYYPRYSVTQDLIGLFLGFRQRGLDGAGCDGQRLPPLVRL